MMGLYRRALTRFCRKHRAREQAVSAVEYTFMAALIAAVIVAIVLVLGQQTNGMFECTSQSIQDQTSACPTP